MGMFSKLFGGSGSDKADRMRQAAIDAFNAIKTPELRDLQVQLDKYVLEGRLSPEQAEAELLNSNAFNDIVTDPALEGAQKQALMGLQQVANEGGLTAIDKARLADITSQQNQEARGRNEAVLSQARERGMGGSDITTINQLLNEQSAADRASRAGTDVAAQAQARALQAMIAAGDTATGMRSQSYGEQAQKAQAENAIDLFNKQTLNQTNLYNVDTANKAEAANLAAKQAVSDANVNTGNQNKLYNASQVQQDFQNKMGKASGVAGTYNQWANDASQKAAADHAADVGFTTGLIKAGATGAATAFGGPAAGAATAAGTSNIGGGNTTNSNYKRNPDGSYNFAEGGMVEMEPDEFKKEHNRLLNVLNNPTPSATQEEAERQRKEMEEQNLNCGGMVKMADGGQVPDFMRRSNTIQNPTSEELTHDMAHGGFVYPIENNPDNKTWDLKDKSGTVLGNYPSYVDASMEAERRRTDMRPGGPVPGAAPMPGDHPANDVVPAKLSPGEVVVPRSAMTDDEEFEKFMEQFRPSKRNAPVDESIPMEKRALKNLSRRSEGK